MSTSTPFKTCPMCGTIWAEREVFLSDQNLELNGYQADFEKLEYGLFYFTHQTPDCRSTMALQTVDFLDLYTGTRYSERRTGEAECPGYCLDRDQLNRCDALCECAFFREIIQLIRERQKKKTNS